MSEDAIVIDIKINNDEIYREGFRDGIFQTIIFATLLILLYFFFF